MINVNILDRSYLVPTRWDDLSLDTYIAMLQRETTSEIDTIAFFTTIERAILERLSLASWVHLLSLLDFLKTSEPVVYENPTFDVSQIPYGAYVDACAAIERAKDKPENAIALVYSYYTFFGRYNYRLAIEKAERVRKESYVESFGVGRTMVNKTIEYANAFAKALRKIPESKEERAANFHLLDRFGVQNVLDSLTGGDIAKEEYYLRMPTGKVHNKLLKQNYVAYCNHLYLEATKQS